MTRRAARTARLLRGLVVALLIQPIVAASAQVVAGNVDVGEGVRIHYVEAGDPGAFVTVLLVPGWSTSSAIWRDQVASLSATSRVVAIDPRSQGESTVSLTANTPEQRARDLRAVVQSLRLTNVVLVGWSQGVQDLAAYAAAYQGEGVAGYVLVDSTVGSGPAAAVQRPRQLEQQLARMALYVRHQKEFLRGMMEAIITSPRARERIDEYVAIGSRTPPDIGVSMLLMDFIAVDRTSALAAFNRPTLVIAASQSEELQAQRDMATRIGQARLETIDNAGHAVFLDQPERFRELLEAFIRSVR